MLKKNHFIYKLYTQNTQISETDINDNQFTEKPE